MEFKAILSSDANFQRAKEALKYCWNERAGEAHVIEIKPYKHKRSTAANAYYWAGVITPLSQHCGYTPEEMHEVILAEIYGTKIIEFKGHKREVPNRRTHDMNTAEFAQHIEHCHRIAAEMGVSVEPFERAA